MGTHKQQAIAKTTKKPKRRATSKLEAKLVHINTIAESLLRSLPAISELLVEEERPVVLFSIKYKPDGRYMAILSYDADPRDQIAFGVGDTPLEALHGLEMRIMERGFTDAFSYEERIAQAKTK